MCTVQPECKPPEQSEAIVSGKPQLQVAAAARREIWNGVLLPDQDVLLIQQERQEWAGSG